jgi:hypothetical protein
MKQIYLQNNAQTQNQRSISDASVGKNIYISKSKPSGIIALITPPNGGAGGRLLVQGGSFNIFLIQNKGKGPPGDIRHPDHPPDSVAGPPDITPDRVQNPVGGGAKTDLFPVPREPALKIRQTTEINMNTEVQNINTNQYSNFLQTLNFTNMKKQILFLAFFILVALAGINKSYGQVSTTPDADHLDAIPTYCATYTALTCGAGTGLNPLPGVSYPYTITTTSAGRLHWFVTDDANIITTQGTIDPAIIEPMDGSSPYVLTADAAYDAPTSTSLTVNITWKAFDGAANNVILVVYNTDDANCTDNMEVYRIEPKYSFTLDIAGIADAGDTGGAAVEDCVNPIQTATYDGTSQTLTLDYGTDYVFFAVNAANWMTSWMPDNFTATTDGTSVVTVDGWAYPDDAATTGAWNAVGTDPVLATQYTNNVDGFIDESCIIVRVRVEHASTTENITAETINLTVNGEMVDPADGTTYSGYPDLDEPTSGTDCAPNATTDNVDIVITPRPTVAEDTPTPFETKVP